ncbi:hypothetical protein ACFQZO_23935 [Bradyrhizobium sp. GCM10027634]|uniref:hypothetical protein n=1 Tax=unclassified Bradyrhizobium TaxID=2631580 RepID=UPI00188B20B8|nr:MULTISPECIES: hypothetical protein [unclassified Bradyrhizobium]MDN5003891.1 hypothetical protein [Bradyrhizobium sp. WYCCWR 12677]QOZ45447.1 hypothetical protein XH89_19615 [Bradyrhizobium sp. CCBAU 53340]
MPIPTQADHNIAAIQDLGSAVVMRLQIMRRAGPGRGRAAKSAIEALAEFVVAVKAFIDADE